MIQTADHNDIRIEISDDGTIAPERHTEEERRFFEGWQPVPRTTDKDEQESERVGRQTRAAAKQCWFNARRTIQNLGSYDGASYVEGYIVCKDGFGPIEHGWVVREGLIIDPTLPDSVARYFPGLEFVGREGIAAFLATPRGGKCRRSPFFSAFGWGGHESPSMATAYRESMAWMYTYQREMQSTSQRSEFVRVRWN